MDDSFSKAVADSVMKQCKAAAKPFRADPQAAYGPVFETVVENSQKLTTPLKNKAAWIDTTAWWQARRWYLEEKKLQKGENGLKRLEFEDERDSQFVLDHRPVDVCDLLIRQEDEAATQQKHALVRVAAENLPRSQWEALLVTAGAQGCDPRATELPDSVAALATLRGCSRQHIYDLGNRAAAALKRLG